MNKENFEQIVNELAEKGYDRGVVAVVTRVKRNNIFHHIFSPMQKGVLTLKTIASGNAESGESTSSAVVTYFPLKSNKVNYNAPHTFSIDSIIPAKCSLQGTMQKTLNIKHKTKNKDEFYYNSYYYDDAINIIVNALFKDYI